MNFPSRVNPIGVLIKDDTQLDPTETASVVCTAAVAPSPNAAGNAIALVGRPSGSIGTIDITGIPLGLLGTRSPAATSVYRAQHGRPNGVQRYSDQMPTVGVKPFSRFSAAVRSKKSASVPADPRRRRPPIRRELRIALTH